MPLKASDLKRFMPSSCAGAAAAKPAASGAATLARLETKRNRSVLIGDAALRLRPSGAAPSAVDRPLGQRTRPHRFSGSAALDRRNRILVVEHSGRLAGLIVDSASEVLKIPADAVETPPAVFQEGGLNCVTGLGKVAGRLIVLLDMNKLLAPASLENKPQSGEKVSAAKAGARN